MSQTKAQLLGPVLGNVNYDSGTLFVDSENNRVGIGTTVPTDKLDVRGSLSSNGNGVTNILSYDLNGVVGTTSNHSLGLFTAGASKVTITTTGNVGIGITNPTSKIHAYGSDLRSMIQSSSDASYLAFGQWDGSTNRIESANRSLLLTTYSGSINLGISGTTHFTINNSGNVGIGVTNTSDKLHIVSSSNYTIRTGSTTIINPNNSGSEIVGAQISVGGNIVLSERQPNTAFSDRTDLAIITNTGYGLGQSEKIRIKAEGNVGIGTTNPEHPLEVNGIASLGTSGSYGYKIRFIGAISNGTTFTLPSGRWQGELHYTWGNNSGRTAKRIVSFAKAPGAISNGYSSTWLDVNNGGAGVLGYSFDQSTGVFTWSISDGFTSTGYAWILYHPGN